MEKNENDKFDKTSDFLALMTRSERKAWERAQQNEKDKVVVEALSQTDKEPKETPTKETKKRKSRSDKHKQKEEIVVEQISQEEPSTSLEETSPIEKVDPENLQVGEMTRTIPLLDLTAELANTLSTNASENLFSEPPKEVEENVPVTKKSFNPITWVGLAIIGCFGYFIYLVIRSGYEENFLLFIDSTFLFGMVLFFGISILCNRKWMKIYSCVNMFLLLAFVGTNIFYLYDWNTNRKEKEPEVLEEKKKDIIKHYQCTSSNIQLSIDTKNGNITTIHRTETFTDEKELETVQKFFPETEGLTVEVKEKDLLLTFQFDQLDINQYKVMTRSYLEYHRETSDFEYIVEDQLLYSLYQKELKGYTCQEKEA